MSISIIIGNIVQPNESVTLTNSGVIDGTSIGNGLMISNSGIFSLMSLIAAGNASQTGKALDKSIVTAGSVGNSAKS